MSEIYWITRFGYINTVSLIIGLLALTLTTVMIVACIMQSTEVVEGRYDYDKEKKILNTFKDVRNYSLFIGIVFSLITLFTPNTKEALMIWSVGNTIDYIKTNDKSKQLPDKCIEALDAWIESLNKK